MAKPKYAKRTRGTKEELVAFEACHYRVRVKRAPSIAWTRDLEGFYGWLDAIGPIPENLIKPSVSRHDMDKGYEQGNIYWDECNINSARRALARLEKAERTVAEQRKKESPKKQPVTLLSLGTWNKAFLPK